MVCVNLHFNFNFSVQSYDKWVIYDWIRVRIAVWRMWNVICDVCWWKYSLNVVTNVTKTCFALMQLRDNLLDKTGGLCISHLCFTVHVWITLTHTYTHTHSYNAKGGQRPRQSWSLITNVCCSTLWWNFIVLAVDCISNAFKLFTRKFINSKKKNEENKTGNSESLVNYLSRVSALVSINSQKSFSTNEKRRCTQLVSNIYVFFFMHFIYLYTCAAERL